METFYQKIIDITTVAEQYNIPVFFNAVGVEGYDENDERCTKMKDALNQNCVKAITVRDDFETLQQNYITNENTETASVFDSAVWSKYTYKNIKPDKNSNTIGLGVARDKLFTDHEIEMVNRDYLLDFWKNTAIEIEKRGLNWKIFTNGTDADEAFANDLLNYIGHGEKVNIPIESSQLVQTICSFKGIIACRLHTNIVAYSFKIPSIGLVWNDKLELWGQKIGYPERFITSENLNANYVVDSLFYAMKKGCKGINYSQRHSVLKELINFVKKYAVKHSQYSEKIDFSKHLLAPALGTKELKFKNMNSLVTFKSSIDKGFNKFEFDIRLTSDDKLVLVNGWNKTTYNMLRFNPDDYDTSGLSYDEFMSAKYYGNYPTTDFEGLIDEYNNISKENNILMIIDIGRPETERMKLMLTTLNKLLKKHKVDKSKFIIKLEKESYVKYANKIGLGLDIIYFLSFNDKIDNETNLENTIDFCKKNNISRISMKYGTFTPEISAKLNSNSIKPSLFSVNRIDDIVDVINNGVEFIGSGIYSVDYFNRLTC
jgi:glycerophosphoryl diester phosphodiesterase